MDYYTAVELVAFLRVIGKTAGFFVFQWPKWMRRRVTRLYNHMYEWAEPYYQENLAAQTVEDGLYILDAMLEGGKLRPPFPPICIMALQALRERGLSTKQIAEKIGHGVTADKVYNWSNHRPKSRPKSAGLEYAVG